MTLTDTGPLVALIDQNDSSHAKCVYAVKHLPKGQLVSTWPCFTEAMYLLFRDVGYAGQLAIWKLYQARGLVLYDLGTDETRRMAELMEKYQDTPMDLADASLIASAEQLGIKRIFTLDRDFFVYRLADGTALEVVP